MEVREDDSPGLVCCGKWHLNSIKGQIIPFLMFDSLPAQKKKKTWVEYVLSTKTQNWKSKKLSFNSCITCFHIMAVNVSAIIRVTPQTSFFCTKKKKEIPKTNQGSSNAQKKYILKHTRRKIDHVRWSHCNPSATSWSMSWEPRCWFGPPESSLSPSPFSLFLVTVTGTDKHVVVTVNTNTDNTQPLEL